MRRTLALLLLAPFVSAHEAGEGWSAVDLIAHAWQHGDYVTFGAGMLGVFAVIGLIVWIFKPARAV